MTDQAMRHIALLGSTGSIGTSTLDVVSRHPDRFRIVTLVAGKNIELLTAQVQQFSPQLVVVGHSDEVRLMHERFPKLAIAHGHGGIMAAVESAGVDTVVSAITGTVALSATFKAIELGHRICLANKETLVAAGDLINSALDKSSGELIPIDSEQSAIFQALSGLQVKHVKRMILTASGGPFFGKKTAHLSNIRPKQALAHPRWSMGKKISIDSATLMNKALELIETHFLFRTAAEKIDVWIHPQSIVHSLVEFDDCSVLAQLGVADMRLPIQYALTYPHRLAANYQSLDLSKTEPLSFFDIDNQTFPAVKMAREVLRMGGSAGAVFNAANEVAVEAFLEEKLKFTDIYTVVADTLEKSVFLAVHSPVEVEEIISATKVLARKQAYERRI